MPEQILRDAQRLKLAIAIAASEDASTLKSRAAEALEQKRRRFLGLKKLALGAPSFGIGIHGRASTVRRVRRDLRSVSLRDLEATQRAARDLLEQASAGDEISVRGRGRVEVIGGQFRFSGVEPDIAFCVELALLLATPAGHRVRKCPECGQIFLRVRRQKYCTEKCTDRATWRNYPEEKKRAARAKQYRKYGWDLGARSWRRK